MSKNNLFFIVLIICIPQIIYSQQKSIAGWQTKFEQSNYTETERYDETISYFKKLAQYSNYAELLSFGVSPQGRKLYCLIVSKDKTFTPAAAKKTSKPVILINNGIHAGEIAGKDASMLLLRDILVTKEKQNLINNTILLVIPIFNVDGHERFSPYNRINQNGPKEMGWRTTAQNLNLNRDWMKADAPEMKAMLKLFSSWLPDFFIDTHTTDGADYQYTITYTMEKYQDIYHEIATWIKNRFEPYIEKYVNQSGYLISPYIGFMGRKIDDGIRSEAFGPRFSHAYAAVQNRPGLLIETHMMKPYKDRVFSTKALLNAAIEYLNGHPNQLIALNKRADENSIKEFTVDKKYLPLKLELTGKHFPFLFKGVKYKRDSSWISGKTMTTYTEVKEDFNIQKFDDMEVVNSVSAPALYIIPKEWGEWDHLIDRIKLHGIKVEQLSHSKTFIVTKYKFKNIKFANHSYESHQRVKCDYDSYIDTVTVPAGTYIIPTAQRTIRVILNLLEPKAEDSFLQWGFFNSIFEQKEYAEGYVMEKYAREMMNNNPLLKEDFEKKLKEDDKFRKNPYARLNFFYKRSLYFDKEFDVYPVMRVE